MVWSEVLVSQQQKFQQSYDYHKHNLVYIGDYIKFADAKAGVALSLNLVLLGFLGGKTKGIGYKNLSLIDLGMYLSLLFLLISAYMFIWKILWPRYPKSTEYYMSWGGIATFSTKDDYLDRLKLKFENEDEFLKDMAIQNYDLARVATQKYFFLKVGFVLLTMGGLLGVTSNFFGN